MKLLNTLLSVCLLTIGAACNGQRKTDTQQAAKPAPTVIRPFKAASALPDFDTTLVSQYIRSIFQDSKGQLWFGTIGEGVVRYDGKTLTYFARPAGFINNTVYAINEDRQGNLWFGTDQGVYRYDGKTFRNYAQKDGLTHPDITRKGILVDRTGAVWVGTHRGVFRYDPVADQKGAPAFSPFQALPPVNVAGILEDRSGAIWFATSDKGVFRYDGQSITTPVQQEELGENYAGGIAQDKAGNLWFTFKNGICKYDGHTLTEYTAKDGLGGTEFWGIYIETSGIIWVTARGSTTRFDPTMPLPNPKAFRVFTQADGLTCCVQSMYQDKAGNMWWGTGQGLYRFDGNRFYQVKQRGPW
ncbi:ligand-binding sensor domain-containing protein [Arsenicibacter rosenii]|uniref:Regulator n=1 Tax=Arsenicibacter rosenii TaxID=1750698 RepID=A0A1S2VF38_9BACT|nr:two-component regulator propeller domain-containing protein [Arsenicibacter rosenii]OIN57030.1 regulator [Arsenicibacter rosenii]